MAKKNSGKEFEKDIKESVPKEYFYYRFKDGTANIGNVKNDAVRFQAHNICDCEIMTDEYLFLLELKTHQGSSIAFNCIRDNQLKEMSNINHKRIKPYFILNFRDKERTFAIEAKKLKEYIETAERKSIPFDWCRENSIEIEAEKKRTRYKYNLEKFFEEAEKENCIKI